MPELSDESDEVEVEAWWRGGKDAKASLKREVVEDVLLLVAEGGG